MRLELAGEAARTLTKAEARTALDRLGRDARRQRLLLDLDRRAIDDGITAHETVHQLVTASGLAPRHDDFPLWLHEGFAADFEVVRGGRWAGIGRAHDIRLPDWRAIDPAPRLAPLLRDVGFGRGYRRDLYAQAWALVYFLRKQHPREFVTFLDLLRTPDDEASSPPNAQWTPSAGPSATTSTGWSRNGSGSWLRRGLRWRSGRRSLLLLLLLRRLLRARRFGRLLGLLLRLGLRLRGRRGRILDELERGRVEAEAEPGRRRAVGEDVAEVSAALAAHDLDARLAHLVIGRRGDPGRHDRLEEAGPAGPRLELGAELNSSVPQPAQR